MIQRKGIHCIFSLLCFFGICLAVVRVEAASAPSAVTITSISAPAYDRVTLKWKKVTGATSYLVYYKKSFASKWEKVASVPAEKRTFTHVSSGKLPIVVGQQYQYHIRAYNRKTGKYSTFYQRTIRSVCPLPAQVKLKSVALRTVDVENNGKTAQTARTGVEIQWNQTGGASSYAVFRKTTGHWIRIATVKNNVFSYTDYGFENDKINYYTVKAYCKRAGTYGAYDSKGLSIRIKLKDLSSKTVRILFIGNSHTIINDMPSYVANYARMDGYDLKCTMIAQYGWRLSQHLEDPSVRYNILYGEYDYVVLQDKVVDFNTSEFLESIQTLSKWIKKGKARMVLYEPQTLETEENKQVSLTKVYKRGAALTGALLIPAGQRWWKYINANPSVNLYEQDGRHASLDGTEFVTKLIWKYLYADLKKNK